MKRIVLAHQATGTKPVKAPLYFELKKMLADPANDHRSLNFSPSRRQGIPVPASYKLTDASTEVVRTWYGDGMEQTP